MSSTTARPTKRTKLNNTPELPADVFRFIMSYVVDAKAFHKKKMQAVFNDLTTLNDTALQCIVCGTLIERNSREHDECMLVNKGDDLTCQHCPWVCEANCGECPVCEDTP